MGLSRHGPTIPHRLPLLNARAETGFEKRTFRQRRTRRCPDTCHGLLRMAPLDRKSPYKVGMATVPHGVCRHLGTQENP